MCVAVVVSSGALRLNRCDWLSARCPNETKRKQQKKKGKKKPKNKEKEKKRNQEKGATATGC